MRATISQMIIASSKRPDSNVRRLVTVRDEASGGRKTSAMDSVIDLAVASPGDQPESGGEPADVAIGIAHERDAGDPAHDCLVLSQKRECHRRRGNWKDRGLPRSGLDD